MKNSGLPIRLSMACGFEPLSAGAQAWTGLGYDGPAPTICAGYTTRLPEVIEGARAANWKGDLPTFCGGAAVPESLVHAADIVEGESFAVSRWLTIPEPEGGLKRSAP